jgi:hypothetical protein
VGPVVTTVTAAKIIDSCSFVLFKPIKERENGGSIATYIYFTTSGNFFEDAALLTAEVVTPRNLATSAPIGSSLHPWQSVEYSG